MTASPHYSAVPHGFLQPDGLDLSASREYDASTGSRDSATNRRSTELNSVRPPGTRAAESPGDRGALTGGEKHA